MASATKRSTLSAAAEVRARPARTSESLSDAISTLVRVAHTNWRFAVDTYVITLGAPLSVAELVEVALYTRRVCRMASGRSSGSGRG